MVFTVLLFFAATFGLVSAGVIAYWFVLERKALEGVDGKRDGSPLEWVEPADLLKQDSLSTISFWDKFLTRIDYVEIMRVRIGEAGLAWSVGRLTLVMLITGSLAFGLVANWSGSPWFLSVGLGVFFGLLPYMYVLRLRKKRLLKFDIQFPDGLDTLARALRAGHPLAAGLQMLAMEAPEPMAGEIGITVKERTLGLSWDQALDNLADRVPIVEVSTFVAAVKLQNRTGGKLGEVLGRLADTMRDAGALKGEVRAIAAHGRMTGAILTILPIAIAVMMLITNPEYFSLLWTKPAGQMMIGVGVILLIVAHFVIGKMVEIRI